MLRLSSFGSAETLPNNGHCYRRALVAFRRRWPTEKPSWYAFIRIVPSERFIALAILVTEVCSRECCFSCFRSSFVQGL
jgi:hypothetical protein